MGTHQQSLAEQAELQNFLAVSRQTSLDTVKEVMIDIALHLHPNLTPAGSKQSLEECFTDLDGELLLHFNYEIAPGQPTTLIRQSKIGSLLQ